MKAADFLAMPPIRYSDWFGNGTPIIGRWLAMAPSRTRCLSLAICCS